MKSFKAKLYIEDNLATIEFDVMMKGKYDEDYTPGWNFGIVEHNWIPEKKELSQTAPRTRLTLSVYNEDDMMMVGEIRTGLQILLSPMEIFLLYLKNKIL